ncbi:MAG: hypothetical protein H6660_05725 [Ardenticatenaceae bacterium]|nr:hypothetical protein [Ardenticatenaceae bacterium]
MTRPAKVTWQVVVRDCLIYSISIGLLLFTFQDGQITLLENIDVPWPLRRLHLRLVSMAPAHPPDGEMDIVDVLETEIQEEDKRHLLPGDNAGRAFCALF